MEASAGLVGIIFLIIGISLFIAILSIAGNTNKTNKLLRMLFNEQNPERFQLTTFGELKDTKLNKKF